MTTIANITVGTPQVSPSQPSHIKGIREGNEGTFESNAGLHSPHEASAGRQTGRGTARRSTGVNPGPKNPIDPRMPNLSPA